MCATNDNTRDDIADETIRACLDTKQSKSFFLFAGAGSGKTRSLVKALNHINTSMGRDLKLSGKRVAVITYTNAARDEITRRVQFNSLFDISTIHSFSWNLISPYTDDIRQLLKCEIGTKVNELTRKQASAKNKTAKTYQDNEKKIRKYEQRLERLAKIKRFIYSPEGNNTEQNSLDHAEVIKLTAQLLSNNETLQKILIDKYPILLIDESQDTKKELMDVFLQIQCCYPSRFAIGLFGDTMQRIYTDGKDNMVAAIPDSWEKPVKIMNHRSRKRIVELCNSIRSGVDGIQQRAREDRPGGIVRVFVTESPDFYQTEQAVLTQMSQITHDDEWLSRNSVKCLTIEHKLAAARLGFLPFYEPLYSVNSYKQGLLDGSLSVIGVLTRILIPLHKAVMCNNQSEIMRIIRNNSVEFAKRRDDISPEVLTSLNEFISEITQCWTNADPSCRELVELVYRKNVFPLSEDLVRLIDNPPAPTDEEYSKFANLEKALSACFSQVEHYFEYISGNASFDTHQGIKGLEFNRVMVIIDDRSSRGTTFSYDKLFGIAEKSKTDIENEKAGRETTLDRTKRLLYVTCSRAKESLAIVYYTENVAVAVERICQSGWFEPEEITAI
jgi:DNA helicase-2/ATP-dependent DNA helicase PcrA